MHNTIKSYLDTVKSYLYTLQTIDFCHPGDIEPRKTEAAIARPQGNPSLHNILFLKIQTEDACIVSAGRLFQSLAPQNKKDFCPFFNFLGTSNLSWKIRLHLDLGLVSSSLASIKRALCNDCVLIHIACLH